MGSPLGAAVALWPPFLRTPIRMPLRVHAGRLIAQELTNCPFASCPVATYHPLAFLSRSCPSFALPPHPPSLSLSPHTLLFWHTQQASEPLSKFEITSATKLTPGEKHNFPYTLEIRTPTEDDDDEGERDEDNNLLATVAPQSGIDLNRWNAAISVRRASAGGRLQTLC